MARPPPQRSPLVAGMLSLQRTVGNAAIGAALAGGSEARLD